MDGRVSEKVMKRKSFLCSFLILFLVCACARHRFVTEKPPPRPEKRVEIQERKIEPREKEAEKKEVEKKGVYHTVERHQTLYRICKTYGVDIREVASLNGIQDQNKIVTGQQIFIPGAKEILKVEIYLEDVITESPERKEERIAYKRHDFMWPVKGQCIDNFEETERKRHHGIDIVSSLGTPIQASESGMVVYSGSTIRGYGNLIILRHSEEFVTVYAHNQMNLVEEGAWVDKGEIIGKVGQTGRASGPHLHFEIRRKNKAIDPLPYLR
jgi:murein DD-endopeptidase MepM/ murein hydrolase activator NlpD